MPPPCSCTEDLIPHIFCVSCSDHCCYNCLECTMVLFLGAKATERSLGHVQMMFPNFPVISMCHSVSVSPKMLRAVCLFLGHHVFNLLIPLASLCIIAEEAPTKSFAHSSCLAHVLMFSFISLLQWWTFIFAFIAVLTPKTCFLYP